MFGLWFGVVLQVNYYKKNSQIGRYDTTQKKNKFAVKVTITNSL